MKVAIREDLEKQVKQMLAEGELSLLHLDSFLRLSPEARAEWYMSLINTPEQRCRRLSDKFQFFVDLGIITVPEYYQHGTFLKIFTQRYRQKFKWFNQDFLDENYPNPSHVLTPGERLWVRIYRQVAAETTSEERLTFLRRRQALLTGAQGLAVLYDHIVSNGGSLPEGYRHFSYDVESRLFRGSQGHPRLPSMDEATDGPNIFLSWFTEKANLHHTLICFCEPPPLEE
jgi:hypothetical protein